MTPRPILGLCQFSVAESDRALSRCLVGTEIATQGNKMEPGDFYCPISMDFMFNVIRLPCGHRFDQDSVVAWAKKSLECPLCRAPFTMDDTAWKKDVIDPDFSRRLFQYAAQSGSTRHQYNLGISYRYGYGVRQHPLLAAHWLQKAAAEVVVASCASEQDKCA
jgi:hypothetical protein